MADLRHLINPVARANARADFGAPVPQYNPLSPMDFANSVAEIGTGWGTATLGAPVDLMSMALQGFGYDSPAPVGGSEWLMQQLNQPATPSTTVGSMLPIGPDAIAGGAVLAAKGMKRIPALFHGTPAENFQDILKHGFISGGSAELNIPGTSLARDPRVSIGFATKEGGPLPGTVTTPEQMEEFADYLGRSMFQTKLNVPPSEVANLRPSEYITGKVPDAPAYNKPNSRFGERETFLPRTQEYAIEAELRDQLEQLDNPYWGRLFSGSFDDDSVAARLKNAETTTANVPALGQRDKVQQIIDSTRAALRVPADPVPISPTQAKVLAKEQLVQNRLAQELQDGRGLALGPDSHQQWMKLTGSGLNSDYHTGMLFDTGRETSVAAQVNYIKSLMRGRSPDAAIKQYEDNGYGIVHPFWRGVLKDQDKLKEFNGLGLAWEDLQGQRLKFQQAAGRLEAATKTGLGREADLAATVDRMDKQLVHATKKFEADVQRFFSKPHKAGLKIGDETVPADVVGGSR